MSFITWYILFGLTLLFECRVSELKGTKRLGIGFRHVTVVYEKPNLPGHAKIQEITR